MLDSYGKLVDNPDGFITNIKKSEVKFLMEAAKKTGINIEIKEPHKPEMNKGYVGLYTKEIDLSEFWKEFDKLSGL